MKPKSTHHLAIPLASAIALFSFGQSASAQTTYYWDPNGATAGFPAATGNWDGTTANWNSDITGGSAGTTTATPLDADNLKITGVTPGGTITLTGARAANTLEFANTSGSNVALNISNGGSLNLTGALTDTGAGNASVGVTNSNSANAASVFMASSAALHELNFNGTTGGAQFLTTNHDMTMSVQFNIGATNNDNTFRQTGGTISISNGSYGLTLLEAASNPTSGTARYIMDGGTVRANRIGVANANGNNGANTRYAGTGVFEWNNGTIQNASSGGTLNIQNGISLQSGNDSQMNTSKPLTIELSASGSHTFDVEGSGGIVNVTGSAQIVNKSGEAGTLAKTGLGTLNFTGGGTHAVSTWTGDTTVNLGTLATNYNSIAASTNSTLSDAYSAGSRLVLNGGNFTMTGRGSASETTKAPTATSGYTLTFASTAGLVAGQTVTGTGIVAGTYIRQVLNGTQIQLSHLTSASASVNGNTLTFGAASFTNTQTINNVTLTPTTSTVTVNPGSGTSTTLLSFGNVTGTGGLTKAGTGRLQLTGTLDYTGATAVSAGTLELAPASGTSTLIGNVTGAGSLVKSGDGTTILGNSTANPNNFSGSLSVTGGTLQIGNTTLTNSTAQRLTSVSSVNVGTGAVVVFRNSQAIPSGTPITLSGTINTDTSNVVGGGFITVLGALTFDGGTLTTAAGANSSDFQSYAFNNTVTVTGSTASSITSTSTSSAGNGIHLAHNTSGVSRTFNVADVTGDANADLTISARLVDSSNSQGATGMTKTGAGTLTLSGVNAYTGLTTVSAGTLSYGVADALSSGAVTVNGGILAVGNFSDTVGAVTLTSGSITGDTGVLTGTSYALDGAENTSVSAILGGTGALTKTGAGTATLSGSNTYTGDTTVSGGVLSLSGGAAIADTNTLLIIDNGKVDLASNETVDKLFIGGVQQAPGAYTSAHASNAFTGSGTLQVTSGPAGFSSWITGTFANGTVPEGQQGAGDDPDNDGISNLVEYAIAGLDPTVGNGALDTFTGLTLSFTKRQPLATDITYVIETSPDLQSPWTPQVTHTAPVNTDAIISHTLSDGPVKNFARLKVSQ